MFRKRPIEVDAFQMTEASRWDHSEWPKWLREAGEKKSTEIGALYTRIGTKESQYMITTLEGEMRVEYDDWIIQGVNGELYLCKPDIFEETYEAMAEICLTK